MAESLSSICSRKFRPSAFSGAFGGYILRFSVRPLLRQPNQCARMLMRDRMLRVSATVASHVKHRPFCQGTRVRSSGRFPSCLSNPAGSFVAGTSDRLSARKMRSLIWWWRDDLPVLILHDRPCVLWRSMLRHTDKCALHRG